MSAAIAELAFRQHGVVARRQLLEVGIPGSTIAVWVDQGRLHPLHRGVYAVGHRRIPQEARWLAGVLACGPSSALSFGSAGQCRGILPRDQRLAVHVSVPRSSGCNPDGVAVHRVRSLTDVSLHRGIPTTTATRTVWDLASILPPLQTRRAFEQAEKLRVLDRHRLAELRAASPSRRGAGVIRALLAESPLPLEATRSWLEEVILQTCRDNALPVPAISVPLLGWGVDFLWERERFVVEADGGDHLTPRQRRSDNERDVQLGRAGYLVRRYDYVAATDRTAVSAELALILRERGNEALLGY
ncbi:MAG: type IV toxin-antitoxin system AbiEi family antitoxin domain-containing protein [Solirubrobacterales bacterium]